VVEVAPRIPNAYHIYTHLEDNGTFANIRVPYLNTLVMFDPRNCLPPLACAGAQHAVTVLLL
jgi:hypothetical protein